MENAQNRSPVAWKILIADDADSVHEATAFSLSQVRYEGRRLQFLHAYSGGETQKLLREHTDIAIILLDVSMEEEDTGLRVVRYIREELGNQLTRIILRTGRTDTGPEQKIIMDYDINDYKAKTELNSTKLLTSIITALRSYHDAILLFQEKERIRITLQSIYDGVIATDAQYQVQYLNPMASKLTGWGDKEARSHRLTEVFQLVDRVKRQPVDSLLQQHSQGPSMASMGTENLLLHRTGQEFMIQHSVAPIRDQEGHITGFVLVFHDATETHRLGQELSYQSYQAGLAEMSTSVLHNIGNAISSVAITSNTLRREVEEIKVVAGILNQSHAQASEALTTLELPNSVQHLLDIVKEAASSLQDLVGTIQAKSGDVQTGVEHIAEIIRLQQRMANPSLAITTFNLAQAIKDGLALQTDSLERYGIEIVLTIDSAIQEVHLPKNSFMQAFLNLIKNGKEAIQERAKKERVQGKIEVQTALAEPGYFLLSVTENGCGINMDKQQEIFRFGYTSKQKGSGFGLHSVATFAQSLGGQIEVDSKGINCGTTIRLTLPLVVRE